MTMPLPKPAPRPDDAVPSVPAPTDAELTARVRCGDNVAFELIMRRHNRRLFRLARSFLGNDAEAEDVLQEAYVRAYARLGDIADGRDAWLEPLPADAVKGGAAIDHAGRVFVSLENGQLRCYAPAGR